MCLDCRLPEQNNYNEEKALKNFWGFQMFCRHIAVPTARAVASLFYSLTNDFIYKVF